MTLNALTTPKDWPLTPKTLESPKPCFYISTSVLLFDVLKYVRCLCTGLTYAKHKVCLARLQPINNSVLARRFNVMNYIWSPVGYAGLLINTILKIQGTG